MTTKPKLTITIGPRVAIVHFPDGSHFSVRRERAVLASAPAMTPSDYRRALRGALARRFDWQTAAHVFRMVCP